MAAGQERTVIDRIEDVDDREIHVSVVTMPGYPQYGEFLDVREFIPSKARYGRGITVPLGHGDRLARALDKAVADA